MRLQYFKLFLLEVSKTMLEWIEKSREIQFVKIITKLH